MNYIIEGQGSDRQDPSKFNFALMSRTSFYSMYHELLGPEEQEHFQTLVDNGTIPAKLGLSNSDPVMKGGHGGASANSVHNPRIGDWTHRKKGRKPRKIRGWLESIIRGRAKKAGRKTDLMSRPRGGSAAMGRFDVSDKPGSKHQGLIRMEVRMTEGSAFGKTNDMGRAGWVPYAEAIFKNAATRRSRPDVADDPKTPEDETNSTGLIYDP